MRYVKLFVLAVAVLFSGGAMAGDATRAEAEKLFDAMDMSAMIEATIDTSLDAEIAANPELAPFRHVMRDFLAKYMGYEAMKPHLVDIYAAEFTAEELAETTAFYTTPTGRKLMQKLPELMAKGAELGEQVVQAHMAELQAALIDEAMRIEAKGGKDGG